jgi:hypothetical protein
MRKIFTVYEIANGFLFTAHLEETDESPAEDATLFACCPNTVEEEVERYLDTFYRDDEPEVAPEPDIKH